jgi:ElaB/YqjD/DUF883 family membrane-anchored ribosome-binding protein
MATAATTAKKTSNGSHIVDPKLRSDVEDQVETLRADIAELTKAVSVLTKDSSNKLQDKAGDIAEQGKQRLDDATLEARERASEAGDDAYAAGQRAASELQSSVVQNPLASLAIAAGVGFLAGTFAKR